MKLISVNVGQPRETEWHGKIVRSSIWKRPVQSRIYARRLNLDGDAQADLIGHGGEQRAVMVYQLSSYQYWQEYLKRTDFEYGQFGENFTVEGLEDAEVCIGDRFRIGGAIFEITQPRVTCYKVGIRMNFSEMPALLVAHKRPGFYFRVIEEGEIGAGDSIEKIADGPEGMTVAEIDALLYSSSHPAEKLESALRMSALSLGWQSSFRELLNSVKAGNKTGNAGLTGIPTSTLAWPGFRLLRVRSTRLESIDVRSFELVAEDGSVLPDALPGQHVAVRFRLDASAAPITRMYSLCGAFGTGAFRIAVKLEPDGAGSDYLHHHVNVGDSLEVSAPRGTFVLNKGTNPVVLVSAGVGVTPMLAMLYSLVSAKENAAREIWWIHSARNRKYHSFSDEVDRLISAFKNIRRVNIYSRATAGDRLGQDYDVSGHLDSELLKKLEVPHDGEYYLCGPDGFLTDVVKSLEDLGIAQAQIHVEVFGPATSSTAEANRPAPHLPSDNTGSGPAVTFARSGISFRWDERYLSLLEAAEACDVPVQWSCRTGVCHRCESGLIAGKLRYSPEPLDPPADGYALICCSTPVSDLELDL